MATIRIMECSTALALWLWDMLTTMHVEFAILVIAIWAHRSFLSDHRMFFLFKPQLLAQRADPVNEPSCAKGVGSSSHEARHSSANRHVMYHERLESALKLGLEAAFQVLDEMRDGGVRANQATCSIMLKIVQPGSKPADVERVVALFDSLEGDVDEVLLSSIVEACLRIGRADLLTPRLCKLRSSGGLGNVQINNVHTYATIIRGYGSFGDVQGVWETWAEMRSRHVAPSSVTLGCMVEALVSNGDLEAGYELIQEMRGNPRCAGVVNAVIYCSVLKGYSRQKRIDRVWAIYQEMLEAKTDFSIVTYNTLVDACARSGEMGRIPELLEDMGRMSITPDLVTYGAILKGYCQGARLDRAFELLETMKQTTTFRTDEVMYNTLLDGCARNGLFERGMEVLKEMLDEGYPATNYTLSVLVKLASRANRIESAFDLSKELSTKFNIKLNVHVYNNLINACSLQRDVARSLSVFDRMLSEGVRPDVRTYFLLLRICISFGEWDEAVGLVRAGLGMPCTIRRLAHHSKFNSIMTLLVPLPSDLVSEVLTGLANRTHDDGLAVELLRDLRTYLPSFKVDTKLQLRCMGRTVERTPAEQLQRVAKQQH